MFNYTYIASHDLNSAFDVLSLLTEPTQRTRADLPANLLSNYGKQSPIQSALNILNKAALEGSVEQKTILRSPKISRQVNELNQLLKNPPLFTKKVVCLGFQEKDAHSVQGYQIAYPESKLNTLLRVASLIPRIVISIFKTLFSFILAGFIAIPLDLFHDLNLKMMPATTIKAPQPTSQEAVEPYQGFEIAGVVCFNSPLRGTPVLNHYSKIMPLNKRYQEMSAANTWRHQLYTDSLQAERDGELNVYTYGSTIDPACYNNCHLLTENPTKTLTTNIEGHHDVFISRSAIKFMKQAIKEIDPTGTIPLIQLHGSGAGKYQFTAFRFASGHHRTFTTDFAESRFGNHQHTSIAHYAQNEKIQALFKKVYEVTGQKKAILIGHSMGGLVSLEIARTIRNANKTLNFSETNA